MYVQTPPVIYGETIISAVDAAAAVLVQNTPGFPIIFETSVSTDVPVDIGFLLPRTIPHASKPAFVHAVLHVTPTSFMNIVNKSSFTYRKFDGRGVRGGRGGDGGGAGGGGAFSTHGQNVQRRVCDVDVH